MASHHAPPPPPNRRSLGEAVAALYTSPDPTTRAAADSWLQDFLRYRLGP